MDNNGPFGVLMTDLSKAFDCLHYGLLIAKLNGYGFDIKWHSTWANLWSAYFQYLFV